VNGFKISERTIYGCMDDKELIALFRSAVNYDMYSPSLTYSFQRLRLYGSHCQ
jgi:hypothetical protein